MRNSRHPDGPALIFTTAEWDAFIGGARDGEFGTSRLTAITGLRHDTGRRPRIPGRRPAPAYRAA